jgi:hypothetical protein
MNVLCWSFFYLNDNGKVTFDGPQVMHYMLCHPNFPLTHEQNYGSL